MNLRTLLRLVAVLAALALLGAACGGSSDDTTTDPTEAEEPITAPTAAEADEPAAEPTAAGADEAPTPAEPEVPAAPVFEGDLIGLFGVDATACDGDEVSGSYFRMIQPGGTLEEGGVPNADSPCTDGTFSALEPGADGGLRTDSAQLPADPLFDDKGNGLSAAIVTPVKFFAVNFALAVDGDSPTINAADGELTGDMSGWTAYYADLEFNQGAPKADGTMPGLTAAVSGTIDPETGAYVLEWSSQIEGGSFNDFTGVWHLEGTFTPAG